MLFSRYSMQPPKQLKVFAFHEFPFWLSHTSRVLHHENTTLFKSWTEPCLRWDFKPFRIHWSQVDIFQYFLISITFRFLPQVTCVPPLVGNNCQVQWLWVQFDGKNQAGSNREQIGDKVSHLTFPRNKHERLVNCYNTSFFSIILKFPLHHKFFTEEHCRLGAGFLQSHS